MPTDAILACTRIHLNVDPTVSITMTPIKKGASGRTIVRVNRAGQPPFIGVHWKPERPDSENFVPVARFLKKCKVNVPEIYYENRNNNKSGESACLQCRTDGNQGSAGDQQPRWCWKHRAQQCQRPPFFSMLFESLNFSPMYINPKSKFLAIISKFLAIHGRHLKSNWTTVGLWFSNTPEGGSVSRLFSNTPKNRCKKNLAKAVWISTLVADNNCRDFCQIDLGNTLFI